MLHQISYIFILFYFIFYSSSCLGKHYICDKATRSQNFNSRGRMGIIIIFQTVFFCRKLKMFFFGDLSRRWEGV